MLERAAATLEAGGVVLHATEGVWGLACDPLKEVAVQRILALKGRAMEQGLLLIGADASVFAAELARQTDALAAAARASWPGPHSWILPNVSYPHWVTGGRDTVGCRVPGHPQARALCAAFGAALVSTSANRSGEPAIVDERHARREFAGEVDLMLPGQVLQPGKASTIHGLTGEILR